MGLWVAFGVGLLMLAVKIVLIWRDHDDSGDDDGDVSGFAS